MKKNIDNISGSLGKIDEVLQDIFEHTINDPPKSKKSIDKLKTKWQEIKDSPSKTEIESFKLAVSKAAKKYSQLFPVRDLPQDMLRLISSDYLLLEDKVGLGFTSKEMWERTEVEQEVKTLVDFEKAGDFFGGR